MDLEGSPSRGTIKANHRGLFLKGAARKRRAAAVAKKVTGAGKQKASKAKKVQKKEKKAKLKKAKAPAVVADTMKNYRRQGKGILLVKQQMLKAKQLDDNKHPNDLLFDKTSNKCRLKMRVCLDVEWADVLDNAHSFLKSEYLGQLVCHGLTMFAMNRRICFFLHFIGKRPAVIDSFPLYRMVTFHDSMILSDYLFQIVSACFSYWNICSCPCGP